MPPRRVPMSGLTWVQPPDLLAHELVASVEDGKEVDDVRRRWERRAVRARRRTTASARRATWTYAPAGRGAARRARRPGGARRADAARARRPRRPSRRPGRHRRGTPGSATTSTTGCSAPGWVARRAACSASPSRRSHARASARSSPARAGGRWPSGSPRSGCPTTSPAAGRGTAAARRQPGREHRTACPRTTTSTSPCSPCGVIEQHGRDFTTDDVAAAWLADLPGGRVFTAERVAYRNLLLGETAPRTATLRNPFREWIGAQIRADVYGWVCPGEPAEAARLAWRDARLSHVRSGVYGAMCVAAMCAQAVVSDDVEDVLEAGRSVVPPGQPVRRGAAGRHRAGALRPRRRGGARRAGRPLRTPSLGARRSTTPR